MRLCVVATKDNTMGFIHIASVYIVYIMSSFSMHYFVLLNTLDACLIAVDEWSNSNRITHESAYFLWTWCLYIHDHCREHRITICFYVNCPTVICYPPYAAYMRDAARENYGPRVYSLIYLQTLLLPCCLYLLFILFFNLQLSTIIYTLHLLANNEIKGIDNPLAALGASVCSFVCSRWRRLLIDIPIGSINLGS